MKPDKLAHPFLTFKNSLIKFSSKTTKRNLFHKLYGTSSKPAPNSLNSKLNIYSVLKNTTENVLPAFWKSVTVSSSILNYMFSSFKKSEVKNETLNSKLNEEHKGNIDPNSIISKSEEVHSIPSNVKPEESNHLEEAFFDWLAGSGIKKKENEIIEKNEKSITSSKKAIISKSSLQQRSRFLVLSLSDASSAGSQLLRLEEVIKHLLLYPEQKTEMCKVGLVRIALHLKYSSDDVVKDLAQTVLALVGYHNPPRGKGIRILSIDGGGTRGIMAIEVLRQLEAITNKRTYELFDLMCGVSSGAILSLLLGGLRYSLDDCESLYRKLSDEVFSQSTFWGTGRLMWSHAYYDTTMWVNVLKKTFGENLLIETSKNKDSPKIAVVSAIMNLPHLQPFVFRNYDFAPRVQSHYLGSCRYRMWESIRATGAAPGYFEEYCLDEFLHQDGGIMINNPTALGIHEARLIWPSEPIQCVLSLGSGRYIPSNQPSFTSTNLKTKVLKIIDSATDTEGVHITLNDLLSPYTYFRINPYLTEFLTLDENRAEKLDQMKSDAQMYLRRNEYKFSNCAATLSVERSYLKKVKDWLVIQKDSFL